jgi:hypothetical protein
MISEFRMAQIVVVTGWLSKNGHRGAPTNPPGAGRNNLFLGRNGSQPRHNTEKLKRAGRKREELQDLFWEAGWSVWDGPDIIRRRRHPIVTRAVDSSVAVGATSGFQMGSPTSKMGVYQDIFWG